MNIKTLKLVRIGNSRGVRIPREFIESYHFGDEVVCEQKPEGILLKNPSNIKLSMEDTFKSMAQENEDWSDFAEINNDFSCIE